MGMKMVNTLEDKKVLVTGGCGFLGSHCCEYYIKKGDQVVAFDNMTKYELTRTGYATDQARDHNWNLLKKMGVELVKGDVRDKKHLFEVAKDCDFIIHTAAQPAMTISWEDPELDFSTNVQGTFNVLLAAKEYKIPAVSCATVHVYGNKINEELTEGSNRYLREPAEIGEDYPTLQGLLTPLHASKRAADIYVQTFIDTYHLPLASFRLTGIYGPQQFGGEDHGWVANFAIRAVLGLPINIFGTGKQVRDILYAKDAVLAFDAFYKNRKPGIYNIGGENERHNIDIVHSLCDSADHFLGRSQSSRSLICFVKDRLGHDKRYALNIGKMRKELGWSPSVSFDQGLKDTVAWYLENKKLWMPHLS